MLAPEILRHEPAGALFAGEDGLEVIAPLISELSGRPRVRLAAIEIGAGQGAAASELARRAAFDRQPAPDLAGIERVRARAPGAVSAPLKREQASALQVRGGGRRRGVPQRHRLRALLRPGRRRRRGAAV